MYKKDDLVRVRRSQNHWHVRTPAYIQGKIGRIHTIHAGYKNPEYLAYGHNGLPKRNLYMVEFDQMVVWGNYQGALCDKLYVDIFEHWLESIEYEDIM